MNSLSDIDKVILRLSFTNEKSAIDDWLELKSQVNQSDLPNMLSWCAGYMYKNLRQAGIEDNHLKGIFRHNWISNTYRLHRLNGVLNQITKQIMITPIKSFGLNNKTFNLGLRPIGDFDFFFDLSDLKELKSILYLNDYSLFMSVSETEFYDKILNSRGSWSFKSNEIDDLDLHWKLFDEHPVKTNIKWVAANSQIKSSSWGKHRVLSNEFSAITISHHHYLQGGSNYSGLCDLNNILKDCDLKKVQDLATEIQMLDIFNAQIETINELQNNKSVSIKTIKSEIKTPNEREFLAFLQKKTLRSQVLYKLWIILGARSKIESGFLKIFRSFSKPDSYLNKATSYLALSSQLFMGSGWHYRYPKDKHQWSTYPDTRLILKSKSRGRKNLTLQLNEDVWRLCHSEAVQVFINGKFVGEVNKSSSSFSFILNVRRGINEISFRSLKPWNSNLKQINYNWSRMQMPVQSVVLK